MAELKLPKLNKLESRRKKKKILLLSDDLRMSSGVGTMSREIVMNTVDKYDWVQIGGAIKHPDNGKIVDMNEATREESGVDDAFLKVYPVDGYGNENILKDKKTEGKAAGATGWIVKPFNPEQLLAVLKKVIR